jgi:hypothetical protein
MKANNNGWTPERKERQAQLIHTWRPWTQSTGPMTQQGMERAKMNAKRLTAMGLYKQVCKICYAKQLYQCGNKTKAWRLLFESEIYMAERKDHPNERSPRAEYCRNRRKAQSRPASQI